MLTAYILAGGRSSRMGTDKALIELAGKPLIAHAATKLRRLTPHVHILSSNPALAPRAGLVPDIHPNTGPIGGIEAALLHTRTDWNLILPVDVPFLPSAFLEWWVQTILRRSTHTRVALFQADGVPQPTLLLVHRDAAPTLTHAIDQNRYKLFPALQDAARNLAPPNAPPYESAPYILPVDETLTFPGWQPPHPPHRKPWQILTPSQRAAQPLWFANLNTPEDLAQAQLHLDALDT